MELRMAGSLSGRWRSCRVAFSNHSVSYQFITLNLIQSLAFHEYMKTLIMADHGTVSEEER